MLDWNLIVRCQLYLLIIAVVGVCADLPEDDVELELVAIVHRHGERTPYKFFNNDPWADPKYWPDGKIQLTAVGKHRMYRLGLSLRERYKDFLTNSPREVFARSSDADRCIESDELVLHGMYKAKDRWMYDLDTNYLPIPIHTVPTEYDGMLTIDVNCPEAKKEKQRLLYNEPSLAVLKKYSDTLDLIKVKSDNIITDLNDISDFYTTLLIENSTGYGLPKWLTPKAMSDLKSMSDFSLYIAQSSPKILRLRLTRIFEDLTSRINAKRSNDSENGGDYKLLTYSTHDNWMAAFLISLQVFDYQLPPYGATIMLEFFRSPLTNEHFVKLFYWKETEEPVPLPLEQPYCRNLTLCSVDTFLNHIQQYISDDWEEECGLKSSAKFWTDPFFILLIVLITVLVIGGIAWFVKNRFFGTREGYRPIS